MQDIMIFIERLMRGWKHYTVTLIQNSKSNLGGSIEQRYEGWIVQRTREPSKVK